MGATFSSAPSSPKRTARKTDTEFCLLSVKQRISSLENLADRRTDPSIKMSVESQLSGFIKSRAAYKGKITFLLNCLKVISDKGELNEPMLRQQANAVNKYLEKIEDIKMQMADVWESNSVNLDDSKRNEDIKKSVEHYQSTTAKLAGYEMALSQAAKAALGEQQGVQHEGVSNAALIEAIKQSQGPPGQGTAKCQRFDGGKADKFDFKFWLSQFETMIAASKHMADRFKLSALRNHLTYNGLAFRIIADLEMTDDNYQVALNLLKEEFLDVNSITDELFKEILNKAPKLDNEYEGVKTIRGRNEIHIEQFEEYYYDLWIK